MISVFPLSTLPARMWDRHAATVIAFVIWQALLWASILSPEGDLKERLGGHSDDSFGAFWLLILGIFWWERSKVEQRPEEEAQEKGEE